MLTILKEKVSGLLSALFLQKRRLYTIPLLALGIAVVLLVTPLPAAASLWSLLGELVLWIAKLIGGLVITLIDILIQIVQYNDFINAPAVVKGWVIVRDVVNMFIIVMMLVIAFATVFRIEEYQYKKLLSKLLIMAVLVNFSKMLTGFFIDFAQVIMLTFVNGFKEAAAGNFVNGFQIKEMYEFAQKTDQGGDSGDFLVAALLALISLTITLVVVAVYLVVFLLRIVFLWLLTIISPLAFVLSAFPGQAKKYSSEWWDYFGKYLSSGPILAFFLWLALAVMQIDSDAFGTAFRVETKETAGVGTVSASISSFGQSDVLLSFIINIILLLGGLWMTQRLGVAGGKLAGAALQGIQKASMATVKAPLKSIAHYAGRKYNEVAPAWANPVAMYRGWKQRGEELREEAKQIATAGGRQFVTKTLTGGRVRIPYKDMAKRQIEAKHYKEFAHMHRDEKAFAAASLGKRGWLGGKGGEEAERLRASLALGAAMEAHQDDIISSDAMAYDYEWTDQNGQKRKGLAAQVDPDGNVHYDKRGELTQQQIEDGWVEERHSQRIVTDYYSSFLKKEDAARVAYDAGEIMKKVGHFQSVEVASFDPKKKEMVLNSEEHAANESLNELSKQPGRSQLSNNQVFSYRVMRRDPKLGKMYFALGKDGSYEQRAEDRVFGYRQSDKDLNEVESHSNIRNAGSAFGYIMDDKGRFVINDNIIRDNKIKERCESSKHWRLMQAMYKRSGAEGFVYKDKTGNTAQEYGSLDELYDKGINGVPFKAPPHYRTMAQKAGVTPLVDIDEEKFKQTSRARESFHNTPGNEKRDFFTSEEYSANKDKYYDGDTYYEAEGLYRWQKDHEGGLSVNSFARGQKNEIAANFSDLGLDWLSGRAGINISSPEQITQLANALGKVINGAIGKLEAKTSRTPGDEIRLENLRTAQNKLSHPEEIVNLSLYNTARKGVGARRLITHEDMHAMLAELDPDESVQRGVWKKEYTQKERQEIVSEVRKKRDIPEMTEDEARREYFTEGLANETRWGDHSDIAIKLKPSVRDMFNVIAQKAVQRVEKV